MAECKEKLFAQFPPVTTEQWMEKVTADLKGADFEKKLVWRTNEGFNVRPMYRAEDLQGINTHSLPGEFPFVRGTKLHNRWAIRQSIKVCKECLPKANAKAKELLTKGVDSLYLEICKDIISLETITTLLCGIDLEKTEINFKTCAKKSAELSVVLAAYFAQSGIEKTKIRGSLNFDPMGRYISSGKRLDHTVDVYAEIVNNLADYTSFKSISCNPLYLNNAGAYSFQELGFALAWGNQLLSALTERGLSVDLIASSIQFNFGVGSNYFMEIAKFRAARMLWATIVQQYNPSCDCYCKMNIHAQTSEFNLTLFDAHVNLLRSQTEAMSAALGGVDSLTVTPFDATYKQSDDFCERIARNQQLLLKEEAHFDKVVDPAAGSYYIETLTISLGEQAWKLFLDVEENGGFWACAESEFIQSTINTAGTARRKAVASRKEVLLGTNQYPNFNETAAQKINCDSQGGCGCHKKDSDKATLDFTRAGEDFEKLRLSTEKADKRPKAFMLTIGSLSMRLARAQFSCNFFACAGYQVVDNLGFSTVEEGIQAALDQNADIVVLCSSDDEYTTLAPAAYKALEGKAIFVVAGAPACMEDLKAAGITEFINVRSNVLETLQKYNTQLGI